MLLDERRAALKKGDESRYAQICQLMQLKEELLTQEKIMYATDKLGITENQMQLATIFHGGDQNKGQIIMEMQQSIQAKESTESFIPLTKEKAIEVFQEEQNLHMKFIDELQASGGLSEPTDKAENKKQMLEILIKQCKSQDELFNLTGVTNEQLNRSIKFLNLEKDAEFL